MNTKCFFIGLALWIFAVVSVFAESFSNRPSLSGLNEVVNQAITCGYAVNERDTVVSRNQNFLPYCGHGQSYFASLQHELQEHLATLYIDHINGPLNDDEDAFRYFTLAIWRTAAGLNSSGFRRSTDGVSFSYGQMQAGDIIGSWIFEDLQKGFSALKWTMRNSGNNLFNSISGAGEGGTCEENRAEFDDQLATVAWTDDAYGGWVYMIDARNEHYESEGEDVGHWQGARLRGKGRITGLPSLLHSADLYFLPVKHPQGYEFYDFDSLDLTENIFKFYESFEDSSDTSHIQTDYVGDTRGNPFSLIGWNCPSEDRQRFCGFSGSYWLLKWNFTNE